MQLGDLGQDPTSPDFIGPPDQFVGPPAPDTTAMDTASSQAVSSSSDLFGNIDLSKLVNSIASGYVAVQTAINAGNAPKGTAAHPMPGTVQLLPGGAKRIVNADGSTTIIDAQGNKQTITTSGQVISGGAPLIDGIPNATLLIAGIGLLGIFLRR